MVQQAVIAARPSQGDQVVGVGKFLEVEIACD